jgi:hypothetical protein
MRRTQSVDRGGISRAPEPALGRRGYASVVGREATREGPPSEHSRWLGRHTSAHARGELLLGRVAPGCKTWYPLSRVIQPLKATWLSGCTCT